MTQVPFFMHDLGQAELDSIAAIFNSPILTTGNTVAEFEGRFADYLGCEHALGVTSCTGALHMSLLALGIGEGDEVITTPMTFVASTLAIIEAGAKPVFVDVEQATGNMDAALIEAAITPKTRAILPVHLYGQMCDMRAISDIARRHNLHVIEDAAHCIEGSRDGIQPGGLADTACFSFYATKNLTCGEGGAVAFNNSDLYEDLKLLRLHGMSKNANDRYREGYQHWDVSKLGWKYNMDNIQAAMLLPQMDRLENKWQMREVLAGRYHELLDDIPGIRYPRVLPATKHAWHLFPVWITGGHRDTVISRLTESGISVMVNYRAIHELEYLRERFGFKRGDFPVAESLGDSVLSLPFYPNMPPDHIDIVADALRGIMHSLN